MRRDLERRLRTLEVARIGTNAVEIWIEQSDGLLRGPLGETITRDAIGAVRSDPGSTVFLPDNDRDAMGRSVLILVINEVDARL